MYVCLCRPEAGTVSESGFEAMLEGLSWAEQMELEEQLAEAQGSSATAPPRVYIFSNSTGAQ
jgi:hypothetical protein